MNPFSLLQHLRNSQLLDERVRSKQATKAQVKTDYIDNNVMNVDLDTPIYRIFNEERFFQMLNNKTLMLVHTSSWDDPFENFLLNARWETANGQTVDVSAVRDRYYGQCWTLREECDGLWRNYRGPSAGPNAPAPVAIKVATTVRKLMEQFYDVNVQFHELTYFLGKVEYLSDEDINAYFSHPEEMNSAEHMSNIRYPQSLLVKRKAFSYEEEVRLIFSDNPASLHSAPPAGPLHPVIIDPNTLYDYIELDPFMDSATSAAIQADIQAAGYTGLVKQSKLYNNPHFVVRLA